jgi:lipopolysaccharide export LptBFGC system permease protein LptF
MGKNPGKEDKMGPEQLGVMIPIVMFIGLFTFLSIAAWAGSRRQEREAFYKAETLRRITEASGEGAKEAIELLREESRLARIKRREGIKIGGVITLGVGVALVLFLGAEHHSDYLVGLIPGLIGVAMLVYVYFMASPLE